MSRRAVISTASVLALSALPSCLTPPVDIAACGQLASCGDGPTYAFEFVRLALPDAQGRVDGFDVDGVVSDEGEGKGCRVPDQTSPDGRPGIDNRLPALLQLAGAGFSDTADQALLNAVRTGSMLTLVEFVPDPTGATDFKNAVLRRGQGVPLLGSDDRYLAHQTIAVEPQPLMALANGTGDTSQWQSDAPFDVDFRFTFLGTPLRFPIKSAQVKFDALEDGRLDVIFGGYMMVNDATELATYLGGDDDDLGGLLRDVLPGLADIRSTDDECDALSLALVFRAAPVYVHPEVQTGTLPVEELFVRATCRGCHATNGVARTGGGVGAGPSLEDFAETAANRVPGMSARDYVRQSILEPSAHIVDGYGDRMPAGPGNALSPEDLERVIDYVLAPAD